MVELEHEPHESIPQACDFIGRATRGLHPSQADGAVCRPIQRTEQVHCGEPYKIFLDIEKAGEHIIHFSMREDGFEFDKWLMTTDRNFTRPEDVGPISVLKSGTLPAAFPFASFQGAQRRIANTVAFFASPRSSYSSGTILTFDGGRE